MKKEFDDFVSIQLTRNTKEALYVQLYSELLKLIRSGIFAPGYKLPPVRKLADYLAINTGTVVNAYKELEKNGFIFSAAGSGSYVSEQPMAVHSAVDYEFDTAKIYTPELLDPRENMSFINMRSISLNPDIVSVDELKKVLIKILDRDQGRAFTYQESQGFFPLRQSIAQYLRKSKIFTDAHNLQIISGAQQGIDIVSRTLLNHGDYVFTETPTYPGAMAAFLARGAKIIDIPLEEDGIDLNVLESQLRRFHPKLIYLMPVLQNPSGCSYSLKKRNQLLSLARYYNIFILEDDYISELSYCSSPLFPLKSLDRDDRIIYIKSFSKIFMPGLRIAFLNMPECLSKKLLQVKYIADISTSGFTQRIFDIYLREGLWQKHVGDIRRIYSAQFDFAYNTARQYLPATVSWRNPRGGLSFWLKLPEGVTAAELCRTAEDNKLLLTDGTGFYPRHIDRQHIRISFASLSLQQIETGMRMLGGLLGK